MAKDEKKSAYMILMVRKDEKTTNERLKFHNLKGNADENNVLEETECWRWKKKLNSYNAIVLQEV